MSCVFVLMRLFAFGTNLRPSLARSLCFSPSPSLARSLSVSLPLCLCMREEVGAVSSQGRQGEDHCMPGEGAAVSLTACVLAVRVCGGVCGSGGRRIMRMFAGGRGGGPSGVCSVPSLRHPQGPAPPHAPFPPLCARPLSVSMFDGAMRRPAHVSNARSISNSLAAALVHTHTPFWDLHSRLLSRFSRMLVRV